MSEFKVENGRIKLESGVFVVSELVKYQQLVNRRHQAALNEARGDKARQDLLQKQLKFSLAIQRILEHLLPSADAPLFGD